MPIVSIKIYQKVCLVVVKAKGTLENFKLAKKEGIWTTGVVTRAGKGQVLIRVDSPGGRRMCSWRVLSQGDPELISGPCKMLEVWSVWGVGRAQCL